MKVLAKILAAFLVLTSIFAVLTTNNTIVIAESGDVELNVEDIPNVLPKGEVFQVDIEIKNNSEKKITKIEILSQNEIDLLGSDTNKRIVKETEIPKGGKEKFTLNMRYNGSGDSLYIHIRCLCYLEGETTPVAVQYSQLVVFKEESSGDYTPPTNTSRFEPNIKVKSDIKMPIFNAGQNVVLSFPIINDSNYEAKSISASVDTANENNLPFTFDQIVLNFNIDKLPAKKDNKAQEEKITYNIKIKADAKDGIYPIKLNYKYQNIHNDTFTSSEVVYIKIVNDKTPPKLIMENIQTFSNDPSPGNIMSLTLSLKNQGSLPAKDIKVSLKGLSSDGITTYKSADSRFISHIDGQGNGKVEYMLVISEKFTGNNASLQADIEYEDGIGNKYSEGAQFFIRINDAKEEEDEKIETKPEVILRDLDYPKDIVQGGSEFDIGFIIDNKGTGMARNVKVSLSCESGILPKSSSVVQLDTLEIDKPEKLNFVLFADEKATTKNYLITINVEYEYLREDTVEKKEVTEKLSLTRYAGVYVEELKKDEDDKDDEQKTVPKIIISKYFFEPEVVKAGDSFKLNLSFLNTSKIAPIRNIKITFSAKEGVFIPANSSNTFFIESMGIQGIVEKEVELFAKSDTQPKSHLLDLIFEYEDEKGNQFTAGEEISIPVKQEQRLTVGQLNLPSEGYEGQPIPIFVDYFNMGKSILYNLMVTFEGEGFRTENANYFAGNFEPGRSDYFESMVTPSSPGEAVGELVFTFEDEAGEKSEIRKEIRLNVMGMEIPPMFPEDGMDEDFHEGMFPGEDQPKKLLTPLNIGIATGTLLIIITVLVIIFRKRRIRKAGMEFDE